MPRGRDWTLVVVAVLVAAACARLGVWQLDRLAQRRARNAEIAARRAEPPVVIAGRAVAADSVAGRRVTATGVYDYGHERLWRGRLHQGVPGVHVITPLVLRGDPGTAVLVDRGWVGSPDASRIDLAAWRGPDTATVAGLAVLLPRGRGDVNPATLADSVPYDLLAVGIQLLPPSGGSRRGWPATPAGEPLPLPAPELGDGPHLFYAVQWFSFAAIVLIGTFALLRASGKRRPSEG